MSPEGRTWTFGYDPLGNLTSVTDPKGNATATVDDYTTKYTYDTLGQLQDVDGREQQRDVVLATTTRLVIRRRSPTR